MSAVGAPLDYQCIPMNIRNHHVGIHQQLRLKGVLILQVIVNQDHLNAR